MTANQLVAYNLRRARLLREMTQEEAAEKLEPYLGRRWSKATFSAAETSTSSDRIREFSADDLLAFAAVFELPFAWFFVPPVEEELRGDVTAREADRGLDVAALLDRILPPPLTAIDATSDRLEELHRELPADAFSDMEQRMASAFNTRATATVKAATSAYLETLRSAFQSATLSAIEAALPPSSRSGLAAAMSSHKKEENDG